MATDDEVMELIGQPFPLNLDLPWRCKDCGGLWRVAGAWHPGGSTGAYVLVRCDGCGSMQNGGAP